MLSSIKFVKKDQPYKPFAIKAAIFLLLLGMVSLFFTRFSIAFDPQEDRCLPDHWVYLIDKNDKRLMLGKPYAFIAQNLEPAFDRDTNFLKVLKAVPGDTVEIDALERILINGELVAEGLPMAERMNKPKALFVGKGELQPNNYWFMGETETSFDSRYWGTVSNEQIIGRAYPLF